MPTYFRRLIKVITAIIAIALIVLVILVFAGVTIDLSKFRGAVETSIEAAIGREVSIDGPVYLEFSNWPAIDIEDVKLANIENASSPDMLEAAMVRLQIGLFPILNGNIEIADITLEDVSLNLETNADGKGNWVFKEGQVPAIKKDVDKDIKSASEETSNDNRKLIVFSGVNEITLKNISVNYLDKALNKSLELQLDSLVGEANSDAPMKMELSGSVQGRTYDLILSGGSVNDLMNKNTPWAFKIDGEVIDREVRASGDIHLRNDKPEVNLAFAIKQVDVGAVLEALGLVEGMQASLGEMAIEVSLNGGSLKEILENSTMLFKVNDADWKIAVPNSAAFIEITEMSGNVLVEQGNAVIMVMDGKLKEVPVKLLITGAPMVEYVSKPDSIPLTIEAELLDSRISFSSIVKLPVTDRDLNLALKVNSQRLDRFNQLLKIDLPALGPVSLESQLLVSNAGYEMPQLDLMVGKSEMKGKMKLAMSRPKPELNLELISKLIRLEDFDSLKSVEEKQQSEDEKEPAEKVVAEDASQNKADESGDDTKQLLSYEVFNALNGNIHAEAKKVTAEKDDLGAGLLKLSLKDARLTIEPLRVDIPGGRVQVDMDYTLSPTQATLNMKADIAEFDLATLVRRVKPESEMGGLLTLDAELRASAASPEILMKSADGHVDFVLVPVNFSSGVIDLWAVNLLSAIMDKSTEKDQSVINCVVVRFGIKDGVMEEKAIYLDTTNMRIAGKAELNFVEEQINIKLAPKAKNPEFFNMAIPIKLKGSFEDFGIKIGFFRMAGQIVSFVTSPIHVPIRRVFTEKEPADGVDACKLAWARTEGERAAVQK